jgi:hypothetical protein
MATRHQITCINKADRQNPHERIINVGGVSGGQQWKLPQPQAIRDIETGKYEFYVHRSGHTIDVIVATHSGNKYLKTKNDGVQPDNLLSLPECP